MGGGCATLARLVRSSSAGGFCKPSPVEAKELTVEAKGTYDEIQRRPLVYVSIQCLPCSDFRSYAQRYPSQGLRRKYVYMHIPKRTSLVDTADTMCCRCGCRLDARTACMPHLRTEATRAGIVGRSRMPDTNLQKASQSRTNRRGGSEKGVAGRLRHCEGRQRKGWRLTRARAVTAAGRPTGATRSRQTRGSQARRRREA